MPSSSVRRRPRAGRAAAVAALLALVAAACRDPAAAPEENVDSGVATRGIDTTSAGAIAGIRFMSPQLTVPLHVHLRLPVIPVDAQGRPTLALLAHAPAIRSANPGVLAVDDSGTVVGVALGSASVYATLGAWIDSATVTVTAVDTIVQRPDTVPNGSPLPATFTLTAAVVVPSAGPLAPGDTARPLVAVSGATVRVYPLVRDSSGGRDTLRLGALLTSATTDASGRAAFRDLASGFYSVQADGPAGQGLSGARTDFGPPRDADYRVTLVLRRP